MASVGMDRRTGKVLTGWAHVVQSIEDILTTPQMTRVMRRIYGSIVPKLIDAPTNEQSLMALYVAFAEALELWEPRYELRRVQFLEANADGRPRILLSGVYYPNGHKGDRTPDNGEERAVELIQLNETTWRAAT